MTRQGPLLLATALAAVLSTVHAVAADGVVASIKPVHSLVSAVMEGVGEPELLVKSAASPHSYSMRPSEAGMLESASVVFWVGPGVETFLEKPLASLAGGASTVTLSEIPGITLLDMREGGAFEAHDQGHEAEESGHGHDEDGEHEAGHDHEDEHQDEAEGGDDHAHGKDMHVWLDPENARAMVRQIASTLSQADPDNAGRYQENAAALEARLDRLISETREKLAPVREKPFVVFHDAYHYFERRFDIAAAGSITVNPDTAPGAQRLEEIRARITELDAACVFAEPQFEPKLISIVTEGTEARSGVLDPLGSALADGPGLYFTLIDNMAKSLADCLSGVK